MNRLSHHIAKEPVEEPVKPHAVRRTIRYTAADNARQAIRRQFPDLFKAAAPEIMEVTS